MDSTLIDLNYTKQDVLLKMIWVHHADQRNTNPPYPINHSRKGTKSTPSLLFNQSFKEKAQIVVPAPMETRD